MPRNIRECDAIRHVRCFEARTRACRGRIAPISDIDVINTELALAASPRRQQLAKYSKLRVGGQSVK